VAGTRAGFVLNQLHLDDAPIPSAPDLVPALEKPVDDGLIRGRTAGRTW